MAISHFFQRMIFVFCCCVLWITFAYGEKEILLLEPQKGHRWIWQSDPPWTAFGSPPVYCKCTIDSASLFYISTPFVRVPPSVTALEVSIEYAIKSCSGVPSNVNCSETFDLYKLEQNKTLPDVNPELFTDKVKTIKAGPGELTDGSPGDDGKRSKDVIKVNVKSRGVYFAFFDRSVCQALFSFKVSYGV